MCFGLYKIQQNCYHLRTTQPSRLWRCETSDCVRAKCTEVVVIKVLKSEALFR